MNKQQQKYFIDPKKGIKFSQFEGLETTILTGLSGEKMMMAFNSTLPGHTVPMHSHKHEQIGVIYSGKAKLRIGDDERIVSKGDLYCIPANTPHGDTCLGEDPFVMLDIFYPIRKDFLSKVIPK